MKRFRAIGKNRSQSNNHSATGCRPKSWYSLLCSLRQDAEQVELRDIGRIDLPSVSVSINLLLVVGLQNRSDPTSDALSDYLSLTVTRDEHELDSAEPKRWRARLNGATVITLVLSARATEVAGRHLMSLLLSMLALWVLSKCEARTWTSALPASRRVGLEC